MPSVSVLLPSLNAREFLEPRVESLLNQTFTGWEAIVLDSGSTDGTWEYFQSVATKDSRFQLHKISREGLYAALNRGIDLATGEFLHVATCDDSMAPDFLAEMIDAFSRCSDAGIAVCDLRLINRDGNELALADLLGHLNKRAARNLLRFDRVRTAFPNEAAERTNYRPAPHDCLLHFDGRSVYFSLNQLLIRTNAARAAGAFQTQIGSVADFDWLLRLTSAAGTVHIPRKLAMWRFHGNQLSVQKDNSRLASMQGACAQVLPEICQRHPNLLTANDRAALLLACKTVAARSVMTRAYFWCESVFRLFYMFVERPGPTFQAFCRMRFRVGTRESSLVPLILHGIGVGPRELTQVQSSQKHGDLGAASRGQRA